MKRFTGIKKGFRSQFSKIISRGNMSTILKEKSYSAHTLWSNIKLCNVKGERTSSKLSKNIPVFKYAFLNHYYTKTIHEFCRKIKKGNVYYKTQLNVRKLKSLFKYLIQENI